MKEIHKDTALSELHYHPEILKADGIDVPEFEVLEMFDCDYQSLVRRAEHSTALLEQQLRELETYHEATLAYDAALSV